MSIVALQAFSNITEDTLPDQYYYDMTTGHIEPPSEYVISRREGLVLSYYADDVWDLTPYAPQRVIITYSTIIDTHIKSEAKRLTYLYMTHGNGKNGTIPGATSIYQIFFAVKALTEYAISKGIHINDILKEKRIFKLFIAHQSRNNAAYILKSLQTLLNTLKRISQTRSGFTYAPDKKTERLIIKLIRIYDFNQEQTELIPVSIYAAAAKMRWEHVGFIEKHLKNLVDFLEAFIPNQAFARSAKKSCYEGEFSTWDTAITEYNLEELFEKYRVCNRKDFHHLLGKIQNTCRHLIHQYTGMRERECATLAHDCWLDKTSEMPPRIQGYTSKLYGCKTPQIWITHSSIKRVIHILNSISEPIYNFYGSHLNKRPLIMRTGFLSGKIKATKSYEESVCKGLTHSTSFELPLDIEKIILTQQHLDEELKAVEPDRDWSLHEWIKVGSPWKFASHQYRRSLAVYALGSGLVSLFAIKEQFGHLLSAMTMYYGNGNLTAKQLDGRIDEKNHIANYMSSIQYQINTYGFIKNVYLSEEPLYGSGGIHFEKHVIARTPEAREAVMKNAPETAKKFKNGLLHWHDTPMGGCICPDNCDKFLLPDFFIFCKGCDYSVQKLSKIEKIAKAQYKSAMAWGERMPDSIIHRTEVRKSIALDEYVELLKRKQEKLETI